jgi:TPR repeat protein
MWQQGTLTLVLSLFLALAACGSEQLSKPQTPARSAPTTLIAEADATKCELDACVRDCDRGDAVACTVAGYRFDAADGAPHDEARALDFYTKACDGRSAWGCFGAGTIRETRSDASRAAALYGSACDHGVAKACKDLGRLLFLGRGVPRDEARAAALLRPACEASPGSGACTVLGLHEGDASRARALHERGCDAGDMDACTNLALAVEDSDPTRALALLEGACTARRAKRFLHADEAVPCFDLGMLTRSTDPRRATELFTVACDAGHAASCGKLALLVTASDPARAASLLVTACDGGDGSACNNLGVAYWSGQGVTKDRARAVSLWKKACEKGDAVGCRSAARAPSP